MIHIRVGTKVRFVPHVFMDKNDYPTATAMGVSGEVVFVHRNHKMFTVKYNADGIDSVESFKFCDIGKAVKVCG